MTIEVLVHREQEKKKEKHNRAVQQAINEAKSAMRTTQRLAQEIETEQAKLAKLIEQHANAEKRESELMRALRQLTTPPEEAEAAEAEAAAKSNGSGAKLLL